MPKLDSFAEQILSVLPGGILAVVAEAAMPSLGAGPQDSAIAVAIERCPGDEWSELSLRSRMLCESGLWLLAGELDRSHSISQENHSAEGSFWHGIMHRREGDFGNSKYWFRKVGEHPVLQQIAELSDGAYDEPYEFIDACSRAVGKADESERKCKRAQWIEWQALMAYCI